MEKIIILAPAKINLFLNVGDRQGGRPIMTSRPSCRRSRCLIGSRSAKTTAKRKPSSTSAAAISWRRTVPGNIVYRAASAFFAAAGIENYNVSFLIEKKIPAEAGLGGGSSDAAAAIIALDRLYGTAMTTEALCGIGAGVGADVPFCIKKGTAVARRNRGNAGKLRADAGLCGRGRDSEGSRICTADAYGKIDDVRESAPVSCADMLAAMTSCDLERISSVLYNKFEKVTDPATGVPELLARLSEIGASGVRMSGSGPAVFGLFRDIPAARAAKEKLGEGFTSFVCSPARRDYPYIES